MIEWITHIGVGACAVYSVYIIIHLIGVLMSKTQVKATAQKEISVVVAFRNEKVHLETLIRSLEGQNYPKEKFEVILVNDGSSDGGERIELSRFSGNISVLNSNGEGKKAALSTGIEYSKFDFIAQTDADCELPATWLATISDRLEENDLVGGPVTFSNSKWQNLELFSYLGLGAGSSRLKTPMLANGANLAFRKNCFNEVGGYKENQRTSSGDDVFLLQSFYKRRKRISIDLIKEGLVSTSAPRTFKDFIDQRIRWASKTGKSGSLDTQLASIVVFATNIFVCFQLIWLLIGGLDLSIGLIAVLSKFFIDFLFLFLVAHRLKQYYPLVYFPVVAPGYSLYIVLIVILSVFYRPKWKDRKIQI